MRPARTVPAAFLAAALVGNLTLAGQRPGDLDATFGVGGRVVEPGYRVVEDVLIQPDGKVLLVGYLFDEATGNYDFLIRRYHADGSPDAGFGTDGMVRSDFHGLDDEAHAAALQSDGRIVVVGETGEYIWCCESYYDFILVRYEADGSLDTSFGDGGRAITDLGGAVDVGRDLAIQPDGKIVVAGKTGNDFAVVRYHADGSLDTGFGTDGFVFTDFPASPSTDEPESMLLQPDGRIVVGGTTSRPGFGVTLRDYGLARYLPDGSLDPDFGEAGLVTTDPGTVDDFASAIALQPDGKIVLTGITDETEQWSSLSDFAVVRYHPDGSLDDLFGDGGIVRTHLGYDDKARDVAIQGDGRILVVGRGGPVGAQGFTLVRYTPDGRLDRSFGAGGKVFTDFDPGTTREQATALALQPDGRIAVAGDHWPFSIEDALLARYHSEGEVRPDIQVNGADGAVAVAVGDSLEVTLALDPGPAVGDEALAWVVARTPAGLLTYDFESGAWLSGAAPGYRGPLVPFSGRTVFSGSLASTGVLDLYFAVQVGTGGDLELPYFDEVRVTIVP